MSERDDNILFESVYGLDNLPLPETVQFSFQEVLKRYKEVCDKDVVNEIIFAQESKRENKQVEGQKQRFHSQHLQLLQLLTKQRNIITCRINIALKFKRLIANTLLGERIALYIEQLESAKKEIQQSIEIDRLYSISFESTYLSGEEYKEESAEVIKAILYDVMFLLSKVDGLIKGDLREIIKDCADIICINALDSEAYTKVRSGQIVQNYTINNLQISMDDDCCPICSQQYLKNIKYCLNCCSMR